MKLSLLGPGKLQPEHVDIDSPCDSGNVRLKVCYCAICRTDAKMWEQGHRDLVLPRVLGHELVGIEAKSGDWYTVWPGQACGTCWYCEHDRENLCDAMRITGFHHDGGFADTVVVPKASLVPVPVIGSPHLYCFAEPVACIFNGFANLSIGRGSKVIIYGGGVLGLLAAVVARAMGAAPVVVERSAEKIAKAQPLIENTSIRICKETVESDFDCGINACDSSVAFSLCLTKLRKGGRLAYFSGVSKKEEIGFNLLNLIHYKELEVFGSYGPRREHVVKAVAFCASHQSQLAGLVEAIVFPETVPSLMPEVLSGRSFKYIIDFNQSVSVGQKPAPAAVERTVRRPRTTVPAQLKLLVEKVRPVAEDMRRSAEKKIDLKTKPLGALGRIEPLAVALSVMQHSLQPAIQQRRMFVFAGDHGIVEEGVSAYPSKVTVQMVENFLAGGAAINVFCNFYDIDLTVVDMGVKGSFASHPLLIDKKVAAGTRNFAIEQAMSKDEALLSIDYGAQVIGPRREASKMEIIGLGEMGIGNTTAATAVISAVTGIAPAQLAGRGTGVDNEGLQRKIEILEKALSLHRPNPADGLEILSKVGGFELGGICGAVLAAAGNGSCVVLDGIISTAAGLLAYLLCPEVGGYLVAGHKSVEQGQQAALEFMGLEPVLDMNMRLGEGTGAAMTMHIAELAARVMCDMASFTEAGIDAQL
ncbi:nicotinate-nucleotide--dimethylbenzimidazole phosphoribosyltransferase [Desulfogranum marinum]|uniref:nicotinate-nucleotide--dimethylbenzimidazole phosphoribosyltransferase n=1 Tax=Desulfogranum marinum TaxID=453220 RepID=UPI0019659137|nr:nicotinate-nucleotide--dimethylbenzimidazole phosphoribosyltransferase [Desulfogranum marinum]MBM9511840.1 nicotinate-nucleotide--dimethylbenzimidazole phosphoribosyltransferase [Desulfogranum marinum]